MWLLQVAGIMLIMHHNAMIGKIALGEITLTNVVSFSVANVLACVPHGLMQLEHRVVQSKACLSCRSVKSL